jgi:hypothetical protein
LFIFTSSDIMRFNNGQGSMGISGEQKAPKRVESRYFGKEKSYI